MKIEQILKTCKGDCLNKIKEEIETVLSYIKPRIFSDFNELKCELVKIFDIDISKTIPMFYYGFLCCKSFDDLFTLPSDDDCETKIYKCNNEDEERIFGLSDLIDETDYIENGPNKIQFDYLQQFPMDTSNWEIFYKDCFELINLNAFESYELETIIRGAYGETRNIYLFEFDKHVWLIMRAVY